MTYEEIRYCVIEFVHGKLSNFVKVIIIKNFKYTLFSINEEIIHS